MRYIILTTLLLTSIFGLQAQQKKITYTTKNFKASSIKSLDASTSGGSIQVEGTSGEERGGCSISKWKAKIFPNRRAKVHFRERI
ncbi:hypothetical protein [Sphingobacterium populi]|uniref:hypothetical protein n=1 Tax=Sphingobacterium sp. CFCC 11742 TaxID=1775560 RepID=UPI00082A7DF3|nr:hypothetical protein [Sphingobacterium sp. CFCC 11742]